MRRIAWVGAVALLAWWAIGTWAQDADLILYYDYEALDGNGNPVDKSGNGHVGTIVGDVQLVDGGKFGKAAKFSAGGYIDLDGPNWPPDQIPRDGMSLLAWINLENSGGHHAIFNARASDGTWVIHPEARNNAQFRWLLRANGGATIFDIRAGKWAPGEWIHFAGVYDRGAGAVLYINGESVFDAPGGAEIAEDWGQGARVGKNIDDARPFTGLMDDLNIWKRGLTQDEVKAIMEFGPLPQAVSPQGKAATTWAMIKSR